MLATARQPIPLFIQQHAEESAHQQLKGSGELILKLQIPRALAEIPRSIRAQTIDFSMICVTLQVARLSRTCPC